MALENKNTVKAEINFSLNAEMKLGLYYINPCKRDIEKRVTVRSYDSQSSMYIGEIKHQNKIISVTSFDGTDWDIDINRTLNK